MFFIVIFWLIDSFLCVLLSVFEKYVFFSSKDNFLGVVTSGRRERKGTGEGKNKNKVILGSVFTQKLVKMLWVCEI